MNFVIGSGPAGVACAKALIERGESVTMLDAGITLEEDRRAAIDRLNGQPFERWDQQDISLFKENSSPTIEGLPKKYVYGSDYTYRDVEKHIPFEAKDCTCQPTLAQGGLSTAWGAAVMPYSREVIADWPITLDDLAPYYEKVFTFVPLAAQEDAPADRYPLYSHKTTNLTNSRQAARMLGKLNQNRERLAQKGILSRNARLAVASHPSCIYCCMCMYGCPCQIIYNSAYTLNELRSHPQFTYIGGIVVDKTEEQGDHVTIYSHKLKDFETLSFTGERAFIGAGAFATTRIMLQTLKWEDRPVLMKDTQSFQLPLLLTKQIMGVTTERLHTLPQVFLELYPNLYGSAVPGDNRRPVCMQFYSYNELYKKAIEARIGPLAGLFRFPLDIALGRIMIGMGFVHSDFSPQISVTLKQGRLILEKVPDQRGNRFIEATVQALTKNALLTGAIPVKLILKHSVTGRSYHYGGTFPMSAHPQEGESDISGRPYGLQRTHMIDSAVFPSIPAGPILLTIMANAYRIGMEYDRPVHQQTQATSGQEQLGQTGAKLRVGVTGANGYLGTYICRKLRQKGAAVIPLIRLKKHGKEIVTGAANARDFTLAGRYSQAEYDTMLEGLDTIIHCAYDFSASKWADIKKFNVDSSIELFRNAKRQNIHTIFISSLSAYDGCRSNYGRAKLTVEHSEFVDCSIRPGLVYGSGSGMVSGLQKIASLPVVPFMKKIDNMTYPVHVDDLAAAVAECALQKSICGEPVVIAQQGMQFKELLVRLQARQKPFFVFVPYWIAAAGLKTIEFFGLKSRFRYDSLVGLAYANPKPTITEDPFGVPQRAFTPYEV